MARRRINKKVAIPGLIILAALIVLAGLFGWRKFGPKDPNKELAKAEAALAQFDYRAAERAFARAYAYAKDDAQKIQIAFRVTNALFLLDRTDVPKDDPRYHERQWDRAIGQWRNIVNIDPKNAKARRKLLEYFYESADSGNPTAWPIVREEAQALIDLGSPDAQDSFVQIALGRAKMEIAALGQEAEREKLLNEAKDILERLRQARPDDVTLYEYLARAEIVQGQIDHVRGITNAQTQAARRAEAILQEAVKVAPESVEAHVNLLSTRLSAAQTDPNAVIALETDYKALVERFPKAPKAYKALAVYYDARNNPDAAIKAMEQARSLGQLSVADVVLLGRLYWRKSSLTGDPKYTSQAVDLITEALDYPDAKDLPGPRQAAHRMNRLMLHNTLATWHIEKALGLGVDDPERAAHIEKAKTSIHQIEQIVLVTDNPLLQKWRGLLALAQGRRDEAIVQMYKAHRQLLGAGHPDPFLAYVLAGLYTDEQTLGARQQFLHAAILGNPSQSIATDKPEALLEYAEVLLKLRQAPAALTLVRRYEQVHEPTSASRAVRIEALVRAGSFDLAQAAIQKFASDPKQRLRLELMLVEERISRAYQEQSQIEIGLAPGDQNRLAELAKQIEEYAPQRAALVERLLNLDPQAVSFSSVVAAGTTYLQQKQPEKAKALVDTYLKHASDNVQALIYRRILNEPDPLNLTADRRRAIAEEAIRNDLQDPVKQALALANTFSGDYEKAAEQYQAVLQIDPQNSDAIRGLFELALINNKLDVAQTMAEKAKAANLDRCQGRFFAARLALSQGQDAAAKNRMDEAQSRYEDALRLIDEALAARPVWPEAYQVRSAIQRILGRTPQALDDIRQAAEMAPFNGAIARQRASMLFEQYDKLRGSAPAELKQQLQSALLQSMRSNPRDWQIQSLFAEFVDQTGNPAVALALRQRLLSEVPNLTNAMLLGSMAMRHAATEQDAERKQALYDLAGSAFEQGLSMEGTDAEVQRLQGLYAEYLRVTGKQQQAEAVFQNQPRLMWQFYLRNNQHAKAREILLKLYEENSKDPVVLRGLALVAQAQGDNEAVQRYTKELLDVEKTPDNEVLQLQMYIEQGIDREGTRKRLTSFRERYPDDTRGMLLDAWLTLLEGRTDEALDLANQTLQRAPENAAAWRVRGLIYRLKNDLPRAIDDLEKSRSMQPNATIRMELAQAYVLAGRLNAAVAELRAALKDPQAPDRVRLMLEDLLGRTDPKALWAFYQATLEKFPNNVEWMTRAGLYAMRSGRMKEARELLEKAWTQCPQQPEDAAKLDLYLESLLRSEQYDTLLATAQPYTDGPFATVAYAQMAQARMKMGSRVQALNLYRRALDRCGSDDKLMLGVLQNMSQVVGTEEVEKWCREKLAVNPDALSPNLMMFILNRNAAQYNTALGYITACMRIVGPDDPKWVRLAIDKSNTLIQAYVKTADRQYLLEGISTLEDILKLQPENSTVLNNLAYLLADNNERLDEAVTYAKKALDLRPDNPVLMDTYAYTLVKVGRFEEAERTAKMAIHYHEMSKPNAPWDAYKHLGMAQEGLGKKADAKAAYERALAVSEDQLTDKDKADLEQAIQRVSP